MILTTANLQAKNLLAGCCLADYGIKYVQALNLGDYDLAECIMAKMRELYFLRKALCRFVPAAELAPSWTYLISSFPSSFTGTRQIFIDGVAISEELSFTNATRAEQGVALTGNVNIYQNNYVASLTVTSFTLTSVLSGTTNNGLEITVSTNGGTPVSGGVLAGGADQWCLTDAQALSIVRKIDNLCGGCCGCNQNVTDDTLPRYV